MKYYVDEDDIYIEDFTEDDNIFFSQAIYILITRLYCELCNNKYIRYNKNDTFDEQLDKINLYLGPELYREDIKIFRYFLNHAFLYKQDSIFNYI